MTEIEMFVFVSLVVGALGLVVAVAWYIQWKRRPDEFKQSWRRTPQPGSPMHWRNRH
jgi:hypothetical protein